MNSLANIPNSLEIEFDADPIKTCLTKLCFDAEIEFLRPKNCLTKLCFAIVVE